MGIFQITKLKSNILGKYMLAFLFIGLVFFVNKSHTNIVINPNACEGNGCVSIIGNPSLSDKAPTYFINDIFKSNSNEYYRLVFQEKSNSDTKIKIKISTLTDEVQEIGSVDVKKSEKYNFHELLFASRGKYSDLVFEKENKNDGADVSIIGAQLSKLSISSEKEFSSFVPTIKGDTDFAIIDQQQTDESYQFSQLSNPRITFGQVFQANADYITGVTLNMNIVAQKNRIAEDKYRIELREATFDGGVPEVQGSLTGISFLVTDLEKYRQPDGKFKFPLLSKVEKGKYYFVGINNIHANVDKSNYLQIKGTLDSEKYNNGITTTLINKQAYAVEGQLYFITQGLKFNEYQGKKILAGEIIEDLGGKKGLFTYQPLKNNYDLADLYYYTNDISFHKDKAIIFGITDPENPSNFVYKFSTIFPAKNFKISGQQPDVNWDQVKMSYSYDGVKWKEIPSTTKADVLVPEYKIGEFQNFDYTISEVIPRKEIYVKIDPKNTDIPGKSYGLVNFKVEADLKMK